MSDECFVYVAAVVHQGQFQAPVKVGIARQQKTDLPLFLHWHRKWVGLVDADNIIYS